jgi:AcrR family transcriptional regulator
MIKVRNKDEINSSEILEAAKKVFEQYGFQKTTMEDIARSMSKGKSTLYYYFKSKEEIFEQVVDRELNNLLADIIKAIEKESSGRDKLKAYCKIRLRRVDKMRNLSQVLKDDLIQNLGLVLEIRKKHESEQIHIVRDIIEFGVRCGEFKKMKSKVILQLSSLFVILFKGMELPVHSRQTVSGHYELAEIMVDSFVGGIGK